MNKILKVSLIILMILSILLNFWLIFTVGVITLDYEDEIYLTAVEWCELSNDQVNLINDLIQDLTFYNIEYESVDFLDTYNCWEREEVEG